MKSVILSINPEYNKTLMEFLAPVQVPGKEWEMCYRGSEQNFSASAFHSLCGYKGPTVTIVRVNQNVFGGYSDKNWSSTSGKDRVRILTTYSVLKHHLQNTFFSKDGFHTAIKWLDLKRRWRNVEEEVCLSAYELITIFGPYMIIEMILSLVST